MKPLKFLVLLRLEAGSSVSEYSLYQLENKQFKIRQCPCVRFFDMVLQLRSKFPPDKIIQRFIA